MWLMGLLFAFILVLAKFTEQSDKSREERLHSEFGQGRINLPFVC